MGLMDEAVEAASVADARQQAAQLNHIRKQGNDRAEELTKLFGLEFEFTDRYADTTHYVKKYREFGGPAWVQQKNRYIWLFRVDDTLIGTIEQSGQTSKSAPDFALPRICPSCGNQRYEPLPYVSAYGGDDKVDERKADLILKIGRAATSKDPCTVCQARPCECCGRAL